MYEIKEIPHEFYEIKQVTQEEATQIIENMEDKSNYGLFYTVDGDGFEGIDNSDGCAWTEYFDNYEDLTDWLYGED